MEEYIYDAGKAHIAVITMEEDGSHSEPVKVLDEPYHLAYPCVFEHDGTYYMTPDAGANRTVDLYQCTQFPDQWEHHATLLNGVDAVDPTLFFHEDTWWLFVNVREQEGASNWDELFLFYADEFDSTKWKPHPKNPIISDVRRARPAGRLFRHEGILYRPSQDSSGWYGRALNLNEVTCLTKERYEERKVTGLQPNWEKGLHAVHSFSHARKLTVLDGATYRLPFSS
jgi:hypothetical protein